MMWTGSLIQKKTKFVVKTKKKRKERYNLCAPKAKINTWIIPMAEKNLIKDSPKQIHHPMYTYLASNIHLHTDFECASHNVSHILHINRILFFELNRFRTWIDLDWKNLTLKKIKLKKRESRKLQVSRKKSFTFSIGLRSALSPSLTLTEYDSIGKFLIL